MNQTKQDCYHYNWGGNIKRDYCTYPSEYGARCEKFKRFFEKDISKKLIPNCNTCKQYLKSEK